MGAFVTPPDLINIPPSSRGVNEPSLSEYYLFELSSCDFFSRLSLGRALFLCSNSACQGGTLCELELNHIGRVQARV